jgi:hypothetical protein
MRELAVLEDAYVLCRDGRVEAIGRMRDLRPLDGDVDRVGHEDVRQPGFVDFRLLGDPGRDGLAEPNALAVRPRARAASAVSQRGDLRVRPQDLTQQLLLVVDGLDVHLHRPVESRQSGEQVVTPVEEDALLELPRGLDDRPESARKDRRRVEDGFDHLQVTVQIPPFQAELGICQRTDDRGDILACEDRDVGAADAFLADVPNRAGAHEPVDVERRRPRVGLDHVRRIPGRDGHYRERPFELPRLGVSFSFAPSMTPSVSSFLPPPRSSSIPATSV